MSISEIIKDEINFDLRMCKEFRTLWTTANNETDRQYYFGAAKRSFNRAVAKSDLARSLGYTVLFDDEDVETMDVVAVYPMELDV